MLSQYEYPIRAVVPVKPIGIVIVDGEEKILCHHELVSSCILNYYYEKQILDFFTNYKLEKPKLSVEIILDEEKALELIKKSCWWTNKVKK